MKVFLGLFFVCMCSFLPFMSIILKCEYFNDKFEIFEAGKMMLNLIINVYFEENCRALCF